MDLLHTRYASPFSLLDNLIATEQFGKFVEQFISKVAKERDDKKLWEYFLNKVQDKSFVEFEADIKAKFENPSGVMDEAKKETIVQKSKNILNGFYPIKTQNEEVKNGSL